MYKAAHAYKAQQDHILSFSAGEMLCVLEKNNDSWWLASNGQGKVGYVPTTYIKLERENTEDVVLQSVNNAIAETISSAGGGTFTPQQQALLKKLVAHKEGLLVDSKKKHQSSTKRRAPPPPTPTSSHRTAEHPPPSLSPKAAMPPPVPRRLESLDASEDAKVQEDVDVGTQKSPPIKHDIPHDLGSELLHTLQTTMNIHERKSRTAIMALLNLMKTKIPSLEAVFNEIMETIPENKEEECDNLALALANLKEIKDDAQQRNWAIEDDEEKILGILNEILKELTTIDKQSIIKLLSHDQHLALHTLVDYHQMETRSSLRLVILQVLGAVCAHDKCLVSVLLATVLPLELAMDLMNHSQDVHRACYSALVMAMLFSTAEPLPVGHYARLNTSFVDFLIRYVEGEMDDVEQSEQVVDMFVSVILSFNLHFMVPSDNIVMQVIAQRGNCTFLSEKIMMLVNRGDDPVVIEEHWEHDTEGCPPASVLKFLQDIFSQRETANFLYTNDMNVLIDIITRNLTDLSSGDKLRAEYLDVLLNIVSNTNYSESRHRVADLTQSLNRILEEEPPQDEAERQQLIFDKCIVEKIMLNFGHLFR